MNNVGIISPRILKRINQKRNFLEHEYKNPEKEQVDDALDVATLFIAYTEKFLVNALTECEPYHDIKSDCFEVKLDYKKNEIIFLDRDFSKSKPIDVIKKIITPDSEEYIDHLRWFVTLYKLKI